MSSSYDPERAVLVAGAIRLVRVLAAPSARHRGYRFLATYGPIAGPGDRPFTWSSGWEADPNTALDALARAIERFPAGGPAGSPPGGPTE